MNLEHYHIDKNWTLFLDRDGVINRRIIDDYVKRPAEFEFLKQVPEAIKLLGKIFDKLFIVTNQQGIGKGLMTHEDLGLVHEKLLNEVGYSGGRIDRIFYCPELAESNHADRKPNIGMALHAQKEFPGIDLSKSIMVGDSISDMEFGRNAGMLTVLIAPANAKFDKKIVDYRYESLFHFAKSFTN